MSSSSPELSTPSTFDHLSPFVPSCDPATPSPIHTFLASRCVLSAILAVPNTDRLSSSGSKPVHPLRRHRHAGLIPQSSLEMCPSGRLDAQRRPRISRLATDREHLPRRRGSSRRRRERGWDRVRRAQAQCPTARQGCQEWSPWRRQAAAGVDVNCESDSFESTTQR
jgi:hypothetical protein